VHAAGQACQTLSGSWGDHRDEDSWKSPEQPIMLLIDIVSCGGKVEFAHFPHDGSEIPITGSE
jgi:hypothetical protein